MSLVKIKSGILPTPDDRFLKESSSPLIIDTAKKLYWSNVIQMSECREEGIGERTFQFLKDAIWDEWILEKNIYWGLSYDVEEPLREELFQPLLQGIDGLMNLLESYMQEVTPSRFKQTLIYHRFAQLFNPFTLRFKACPSLEKQIKNTCKKSAVLIDRFLKQKKVDGVFGGTINRLTTEQAREADLKLAYWNAEKSIYFTVYELKDLPLQEVDRLIKGIEELDEYLTMFSRLESHQIHESDYLFISQCFDQVFNPLTVSDDRLVAFLQATLEKKHCILNPIFIPS